MKVQCSPYYKNSHLHLKKNYLSLGKKPNYERRVT